MHLWVEGIQVFSNEGPRHFLEEDNYEIAKYIDEIQISSPQNHWVNFNQTWQKSSLGKGDSDLFKWKVTSFSKERL